MKRFLAILITFITTNAFAHEPPLVHGLFGFQPKGWESQELTATQKRDLDGCVAEASKQTAMSKEDRAALDSIYGFKPGQADFYGTTLLGCLAEEQHGKGWVVVKRSGQVWEPVAARHALRTYMGMDLRK